MIWTVLAWGYVAGMILVVLAIIWLATRGPGQ